MKLWGFKECNAERIMKKYVCYTRPVNGEQDILDAAKNDMIFSKILW